MLEAFVADLEQWVFSRQVPDEMPGVMLRSSLRGADVYGPSDLLCALYTLNRLGTLSAADRLAWAAAINRHQDPETGLYRNGDHSFYHSTAFAVAALELIDARPAYRLREVERLTRWAEMEPWLESRNWDRPWSGAGHDIPGVLSTFINMDMVDSAYMNQVLDWMDEEQDPETGFWRKGGYIKELSNQQLGAAFHFYFVYEHLQRPIKYADAIIDSTLKLQRENGSWNQGWPVGYIDLDATYTLSRLNRFRPYRRQDVRAALERNLAYMLSELADPEKVEQLKFCTHTCLGTLANLQVLQEAMPEKLVTRPLLKGVLNRRPFI